MKTEYDGKGKYIATPCYLNPHNMGLDCPTQGKINGIEHAECAKCGWNPVIADKRHKAILEYMEEERKRREKLL